MSIKIGGKNEASDWCFVEPNPLTTWSGFKFNPLVYCNCAIVKVSAMHIQMFLLS